MPKTALGVKFFFIAIVFLIFAAGIFYNFARTNAPNTQKGTSINKKPNQENSKTEVIATGLQVPWALAFLPDKSILVTERSGSVKQVKPNGDISLLATIPVKQIGESGLHGVALHPNFEENKFVYLYYTYGQSQDETQNKVVKMKLEKNKLIDETTIVDKIPGAIFHDGGRLKFGPDGFLYITTGDALNPSLAQNKSSLAGKILRVTDEGKPAPGNPFGDLIYSFGHRNPQGITWDDQRRLWEVEHGQSATDELNLIEPGNNYGWPTIRGDQTQTGLITPILQSGNDTWAPAGAAFYNGSIFFGGLRGQALYQIVLGNQIQLKTHFKQEFGRIRDVILGPDNLLYITTSNRDGRGNPNADDDKIIRINPSLL